MQTIRQLLGAKQIEIFAVATDLASIASGNSCSRCMPRTLALARIGDGACTVRQRAQGHRSHHLLDYRNEVASATGEDEQVPDGMKITLIVALIEISTQRVKKTARR